MANPASSVRTDRDHQQETELAEDIWKWAKRQAIGRMADLSLGARECWRILDGFPPGQCYPSHWWIAQRMGKSVSAVRRYLRELRELGYIKIEERFDTEPRDPIYWELGEQSMGPRPPRGQTSNDYFILDHPDLIACAKQIEQEYYAKLRR